MRPYEIIAAPFTVWWGEVGATFPLIDAAPDTEDWTKIGTSGDRNYSNDGVTVVHAQTTEAVRTAGATGPVKVLRTEEDLIVRLTLFDLKLEQYRMVVNQNEVVTTAAGVGTAGFKTIKLYRGVDIALMALLVRGSHSPEGAGWNTQYQIPACYLTGTPEPVFTKGQPAGLALEWTAIEDPDAATDADRFGRLIVQHQAPTE